MNSEPDLTPYYFNKTEQQQAISAPVELFHNVVVGKIEKRRDSGRNELHYSLPPSRVHKLSNQSIVNQSFLYVVLQLSG